MPRRPETFVASEFARAVASLDEHGQTRQRIARSAGLPLFEVIALMDGRRRPTLLEAERLLTALDTEERRARRGH